MRRSKWMMGAALCAMCTLAASTFAFAEDGGLTVSVGNATVTEGDQVEVAVTLDSNPGIIGLNLEITYDAEYLTLVSYTDAAAGTNGAIFSSTSTLTTSQTLDTNPYVLVYEDGTASGDSTATGALGYLTFEVAEGYTGDIEVSVEVKEAFNFDFDDIAEDAIAVSAGTITVVEATTEAPETEAPTTEAPTVDPSENDEEPTPTPPGDNANVALLISLVALAGVCVAASKKFAE